MQYSYPTPRVNQYPSVDGREREYGHHEYDREREYEARRYGHTHVFPGGASGVKGESHILGGDSGS